MERFTIQLPQEPTERVAVQTGGRKAIVLTGLPERVLATIHSGAKYRVVSPDGRETTATIVVKGLTATAFLDSELGLELALSCTEMSPVRNVNGAAALTIDIQTEGGFVSTSWIRETEDLSLDLEADGILVYRYVGGCEATLKTEFDATALILVRRTKVADWTGYKMSELVGKTMREMIYTEV